MKLARYGEDRLIAELTRSLPADASVRTGIGDDCAVIGGKRDRLWQLLKTDCIVEGVHFLPDAPPRKIGWKALARAISDIAAMGGLPRHALVTIAVSPEVEVGRVKAIYAGLKKAADRFNVCIVGGETSRSPGPLFLSVALTGIVERTRCVTRAGGRAGDRLYVTGRLGGSLRGGHLDFIPRITEAHWLVENFRIRAMMDLSDGLGADLPRLARASGTGFEIVRDRLPLNPGCTPENAIRDGEDFELLFAIAPRNAKMLESRWRKKFPNLPLTQIGRLNQKSKIKNQKSNGFDHFA
jgi:thiamine-monophosphate kinase